MRPGERYSPSSGVIVGSVFQSAPGGEAGGKGPCPNLLGIRRLQTGIRETGSVPGFIPGHEWARLVIKHCTKPPFIDREDPGSKPERRVREFQSFQSFQSAPGGEAGGSLTDGDPSGQSFQGVSETLGRGHCLGPWSGRRRPRHGRGINPSELSMSGGQDGQTIRGPSRSSGFLSPMCSIRSRAFSSRG